ncbi:response regulator transcription factor [Paenibacillus nasutitermitis]|uniref:Two-component system, response regulator YesN n=1 Tax=Paenibacillus nasutitermitis TaxID=1652958 RepID=A0A916ZF18_9BACL|nr:helix-turn-helix domain-containing protein [Paenibacillus nasutitermitis]GGD93906.1 hypothetical protein GCM10010911_60720 [Paenibacillus nasutitermitis]
MLKILIVDDEKPIRQWFEHVIRQYAAEFQIAGLAANGKEALELCLSANPDIIITDIKMPVMSGLELIEKVMKLNADTSFLILSNYDEFEFVRRGLRIGVKDYLLKAETDDQDIIAVLRKIASEHGERTAAGAWKPETKRQDGPWLLRDVLNQPAEWLPPSMTQGPMRWIYCGLDAAAHGEIPQHVQQILFEKCGKWAEEMFVQHFLFADEQDHIVLLAGCSAEHPAPPCIDLTDKCLSFSKEVKESCQMSVSFGISESFGTFARMKTEFWEAKRAYRHKFYTGMNSVNPAGPNTAESADSAAALIEFMRPLKSAELLDPDLIERVLQKLDELKHCRFDPADAADAFKLMLGRMDAQLPETARMFGGDESRPAFEVNKLSFWEELRDTVLHHIRSMQVLAYNHTFVYSAPTNRVIAYIREHYAEKITMTILAEQVHLNENYLSQLFKKDTGMTLTRFLIGLRMEQAKKLLTTLGYKVNEAAAEVGYASEAHFSTAFKTHFGVSPSQYVESLRIPK